MRAPAPYTVLSLALCAAVLTAQAVLAAQSALPPKADCRALFDLYRTCHRYGAEADGLGDCLDAARDAMSRAETRLGGKTPQAARALAELVCATGCEDAASGQRASQQEFTAAFCD